ncbi:ribosome biogenesis GTPase Der [Patescibacteria group bacterium]
MEKNSEYKNLTVIVGRPNVGKSTLFNRLVGRRKAIETTEAGTTRDVLFGSCEYKNKSFDVADMAGMYDHEQGDLSKEIKLSISKLIPKAEKILFVVDAKDGLLDFDKKIAEHLRKIKKPIYLLVNKVSTEEMGISSEAEFSSLGFGKIFCISAINGRGVSKFLDEFIKDIAEKKIKDIEIPNEVGVAILGRPNVGKSTLFNNLVGSHRAIVSEIPGTTRDTIDSVVKIGDNNYRFIDTAGIRKRKARSLQLIEKISYLRTEKIVENSQIIILIIDGVEGVTKQDLHILEMVDKNACGLIVLINKKDLISQEKIEREKQIFKEKAPFISWAKVFIISAETGENIHKISEELKKITDSRKRLFEQKLLDQTLENILQKKSVPQKPNFKKIKITEIKQSAINPPEFKIFTNFPEQLHFSYKRFIKKELVSALGFYSTSLKIHFTRTREYK